MTLFGIPIRLCMPSPSAKPCQCTKCGEWIPGNGDVRRVLHRHLLHPWRRLCDRCCGCAAAKPRKAPKPAEIPQVPGSRWRNLGFGVPDDPWYRFSDPRPKTDAWRWIPTRRWFG